MMSSTEYSLRPGADDYGIRWNIPREADSDPSLRYIQSRPGVSFVFTSEAYGVKTDVANAVTAILEREGIERNDYRGRRLWDGIESLAFRGEVAGAFQPWDRTLETPLSDSRLFTLNVVNGIQEALRQTAPDWRVQVVGTEALHEPSLMIYPDAVVIGGTLTDKVSLSGSIEAWKQQIISLRDPTLGVDERRYRYVESRIPTLFGRLRKEHILVVAAFPSCEHEQEHVDAYVAFDDAYNRFNVENSDSVLEYSTYIGSIEHENEHGKALSVSVCIWQVGATLPAHVTGEHIDSRHMPCRTLLIGEDAVVPDKEYRRIVQ